MDTANDIDCDAPTPGMGLVQAAWVILRNLDKFAPIFERVRADSRDFRHYVDRLGVFLRIMRQDMSPEQRFWRHYARDPYMMELFLAQEEGRPLDEVPSSAEIWREAHEGVPLH